MHSDPLPFQFWHRYPTLTKDAVFVDVDYPQLIARRRDKILADEVLRNALFEGNMRSAQAPVYIRSDRYLALGCNLKDLKTLERLLRSELDASRASFMFVAEVSITYMPTADADAVIRWASTLEDGTCVSYTLSETPIPCVTPIYAIQGAIASKRMT